MKKKILIGSLALSLISLTACGNEESADDNAKKEKVEQTATNTSEETSTATNTSEETSTATNTSQTESNDDMQTEETALEQSAAAITKTGGLGDSLEVFEKNYGAGTGDETMKSFKNDSILGMFAGDVAINVTLQFESTDHPYRTKEEVLAELQNVIPTDAVKVKEWAEDQDTYTRDIIQYESAQLNKVIDPSFFSDTNPGTFIAILKKNDQGYFSALVAPGNNP